MDPKNWLVGISAMSLSVVCTAEAVAIASAPARSVVDSVASRADVSADMIYLIANLKPEAPVEISFKDAVL
ncbi:MAG: hypothetical protein KDD51_06375 [Bdellovibrionales bacterium]|nr:hypothetical protein [Bdellovibrionales bacterium]